jgi:hypothetical protein
MDEQQRHDRLSSVLFGIALFGCFAALLFGVRQIMGPIPINNQPPIAQTGGTLDVEESAALTQGR